MRHLFRDHRRTLLALVAAVAVIATAVYATGTHGGAPTRARQVAVVGSGDPSGGDQLTLPFDLTGLRQQVDLDTPPAGITGPAVALQTTSQLLGTYHINVDANQLQPFLEQSATATTSRQLTDDARTFLTQQGVPPATTDQAMADIATLQSQYSVVVGQGQGQGDDEVDWKRVAIAVALIMAMALAREKVSSGTDSQVDCAQYLNTGPWPGPAVNTDAGRGSVLGLLPRRSSDPMSPLPSNTFGYAIDGNNNTYVFHDEPGGTNPGQYTFNSSENDPDIVSATTARLRWSTLLDMTSRSVHAEQKMATFMRICHLDVATFVINNSYICSGGPATCDTVLPLLLGPGQRLTVDYQVTTPGADPGWACPGNPPASGWRCHPYTGLDAA